MIPIMVSRADRADVGKPRRELLDIGVAVDINWFVGVGVERSHGVREPSDHSLRDVLVVAAQSGFLEGGQKTKIVIAAMIAEERYDTVRCQSDSSGSDACDDVADRIIRRRNTRQQWRARDRLSTLRADLRTEEVPAPDWPISPLRLLCRPERRFPPPTNSLR